MPALIASLRGLARRRCHRVGMQMHGAAGADATAPSFSKGARVLQALPDGYAYTRSSGARLNFRIWRLLAPQDISARKFECIA